MVSCDDSKVQRYDGRTGAFKGTVATGNPKGWITQIAVRDGAVFTTEFAEARVRQFPLAGGDPAVFMEQAGFAPWGIVFDQRGRWWWSGSGGIARFDGKTNTVVVPANEVTTPVALAVSPDGQLVCSSYGRQSVTVWDISEEIPKLLRTITGPEVRDPAGVAFTTQPFEAPAQFGNFVPQPSNTGRDWTPTGTTIYNLRADAAFPVVTEFGLDTEGGDRAKTQLLLEPMRLVFTLADGQQVDAWDLPAKRQLAEGKVEYQFSPAEGIDARWSVWLDKQMLRMKLALDGANAGQVTKAELYVPFDPCAMGTTILAEEWGVEGAVKAPLIISALDMGQLRLSGAGPDEALACRFTGSRLHKRIDLRVEFPGDGKGERSIVFVPARLEKPNAAIPDAEWAKVRRGLISLLQITPLHAGPRGRLRVARLARRHPWQQRHLRSRLLQHGPQPPVAHRHGRQGSHHGHRPEQDRPQDHRVLAEPAYERGWLARLRSSKGQHLGGLQYRRAQRRHRLLPLHRRQDLRLREPRLRSSRPSAISSPAISTTTG